MRKSGQNFVKTVLVAAFFSFILLPLKSQDSTFLIPLKKWNLKVVGLDHMYPTYLADPLGNRFEAAAQFMSYADYDYTDEINQGGAYRGHLTIYPAIRISILQFRPKNHPELGFEGEDAERSSSVASIRPLVIWRAPSTTK